MRNSAIYSLGSLSSKLVGFILLPLYTKHFSVSDYGVLGILEVTAQLLIAVFGFGLYFSLNRWYWDEKFLHTQKSIFFTIFSFLSISSILTIFLLSMSANSIVQLLFQNTQYIYLFRVVLISVGLEILSRIPLTLMKLQERPGIYSLANLGKFSLNLIFTVYFIVYLNKGIEAVYEAQILGGSAYFLILVPYIWKNMSFKFDWQVLKGMLAFGLPMIFASIAGVIMTITDRYCLRFLSGLSEVGIYTLGFKIANTSRVFIGQSVQFALSPIMYKKMNDPDNKRFYSKVLTYFTYGLVIFIMGISFFSKEIVELIAHNKDYWQAYLVVPIISFAVLFDLMKNIVAIGINITKNTKVTAIVISGVAVLNIALNLMLIPYFGFMGAATATIIAQAVAFIFIFYFSQKYYPVPYEIRKIIILIILSLVFVLLAFLLTTFFINYTIILKIVLLISFPFILYMFHFYEKVEIDHIKNIFNRIFFNINKS